MRFRRRVAANGTKVPPLPSPRAAPALTPIFALAPILARAPIPKPARRCCHRPSSASPLASDAERPPASTLATSPPLRPSALAFPSRLPISPSHLAPHLAPIAPISPPHLAPIAPVSPISSAFPRYVCMPLVSALVPLLGRARPLLAAPSAPAPAHRGVFGPPPASRTSPGRSREILEILIPSPLRLTSSQVFALRPLV